MSDVYSIRQKVKNVEKENTLKKICLSVYYVMKCTFYYEDKNIDINIIENIFKRLPVFNPITVYIYTYRTFIVYVLFKYEKEINLEYMISLYSSALSIELNTNIICSVIDINDKIELFTYFFVAQLNNMNYTISQLSNNKYVDILDNLTLEDVLDELEMDNIKLSDIKDEYLYGIFISIKNKTRVIKKLKYTEMDNFNDSFF